MRTFTSVDKFFKNMTILESTEFELIFQMKQSFIDKVTQVLKERHGVKQNIDRFLNVPKDTDFKNIINEECEGYRCLNYDRLYCECFEYYSPWVLAPQNNIVKEVQIRPSDQTDIFKSVFTYCTPLNE